MNRRGLSLLEMLLAITITSVIGVAVSSMMVSAANSLSSKDDGRSSAIRLATTKIRLGAYIAPSLCVLDKSTDQIVLWFDDSRESSTVHASEIRWIVFDDETKTLSVMFVDFPDSWTQAMVDAADIECTTLTNYDSLLSMFYSSDLITTVPLVDSMETCSYWINQINPLEATRVCIRFSLVSDFGVTKDSIIDESIRLHFPPIE